MTKSTFAIASLRALPTADGPVEVTVEGKPITLSNLGKLLYPQSGWTKADVIGYYARIAPTVLPHVRGRPITLKRYPDGVTGKHFYEKQVPPWTPDWIQTASIWSEPKSSTIDFLLISDLRSLVWSANSANIELHPILATTDDLAQPTAVAFDLDPGEPAGLIDCAEVAVLLGEMFAELRLESFVKTSGSKGMHVVLPLRSDVTYDETKAFARTVAELLEARLPDRVTANMAKHRRAGRVLVDWSQNTPHKSTVAPYSLRAKTGRPTVSTPVSWQEVRAASESRDAGALYFESEEALARVERIGDIWAPALELSQRLPRF